MSAQAPGLHVHGRYPMTRIGILISALILLVFASPSHALTFHYSFGGVEGLISGLEDNSVVLPGADSVTVTASPIGGLGEYAPGLTNHFTVFNGVLFIADTDFLSFNFGNTFNLGPNVGFLKVGSSEILDNISFLSVADTPLPAALPLFATGLGALGLVAWRRKKKAALTA